MIDIDPTVDFACKMLLGNPEHPQLTIHFLNSVMRPVIPIVGVEYLNPIQPQQFEDCSARSAGAMDGLLLPSPRSIVRSDSKAVAIADFYRSFRSSRDDFSPT